MFCVSSLDKISLDRNQVYFGVIFFICLFCKMNKNGAIWSLLQRKRSVDQVDSGWLGTHKSKSCSFNDSLSKEKEICNGKIRIIIMVTKPFSHKKKTEHVRDQVTGIVSFQNRIWAVYFPFKNVSNMTWFLFIFFSLKQAV